MKEKLKTLSLAELKELAKAQGLKGISSMRKQQLIDWLAEHWEAEVKKQQEQKEAKAEAEEVKEAVEDVKDLIAVMQEDRLVDAVDLDVLVARHRDIDADLPAVEQDIRIG